MIVPMYIIMLCVNAIWLYDFIWYLIYASIPATYKTYSQIMHHSKKKNNGNKNNKTLVKRKEDVGTPKFCKQGGEANIGPEIEQTTSV